MVYVIYQHGSDIDDFVTENKASALMRAGELVDNGVDHEYLVYKYDLTYDEYIDALDAEEYVIGTYNLKEFIEQFGAEAPLYELSPAEKERLINLAPEEKAFVVMFIEDNVLLAELSRRMDQYRKFTEKIGRANDELRIFV